MIVALVVVAVILPPAYVHWRVRRQMRIRPGTRTNAPTWWLVSTVGPARLHRRLRRAAAGTRAAADASDPAIREMAHEAEHHALALEAPLLVAARLGRAGSAELRALSEQTTELEAFVARLANVVRQSATAPVGRRSVQQLQGRLDALEAAHAELDALEARAGLHVDR